MNAAEKIQFLVFALDERPFGIRLSQSQRVIRAVDCTPLPQAPSIVLGVINLHGQIVPVFNIRKRFGFPERDIRLDDHFIIARTTTIRTMALLVDSVTGVVEQDADTIVAITKVLPAAEQIEGVVALGEGIMLIHDLDRFLSAEERQTLEHALTEQPGHGS